MPAPKLINIFDILPDIPIDFSNYRTCEQTVITPALEAAGYIITGLWATGDGDSFGPLSRYIKATIDGEAVEVWYG